MQIILLDKVVNLGNLGEIVRVKDGYARNFLIPSGRARRATAAAKQEFEAKRVELEKAAATKLAESQALGEKLAGSVCKLTQKAGGVTLNVGLFINAVIQFTIVAFAVFWLVKVLSRLQRKEEAKPAAPVAPSRQEVLLEEIRDLLKARQ